MTAPDWWDEAQARRVARFVARQQRSRYLPDDEYEAVALGAIAIKAAECKRELTKREMTQAAFQATAEEANKVKSMRGQTQRGEPAPRFAAYWHGNPRLASPFEERVLERLALWQVWACLDERTRNILIAYAVAETPPGRARLAGYSPASWTTVLGRAREQARQLWYDHERDPGHYPYGRKRRQAA